MSVILHNARVVLSTSTSEGLHDVSASTTKVMLAREWEAIDTTCVLDTVQKSIAGREEWAFSVDMLQAFTTESYQESGIRLDDLLAALAERTTQNLPFLVQVLVDRDRLRAVDNPEYSGLCLLDGYSPLNGSIGDLLKVQPEFIGVSDLTRDAGREDNVSPDDMLVVQLSDTLRTMNNQSFLVEDEPIILQEVATIIDIGGTVSKTASDSILVDLLETTLILKDGIVERTTSDTLTIQEEEGALQLAIDGTTLLTVTDTLEVHFIQDGQTVEKFASDSCAVGLTETAVIAIPIIVSDTVVIQSAEAVVSGVMTTFTESLRAVSSESILRLSYETPAFIQQAQDPAGAGTSANIIVMGSNVTAGSLLVVCAAYGGQTISSVTDTQGNTWQEAIHRVDLGGTTHLSIWYAINATAGATTVSVNYTGNLTFGSAGVTEHSGCNTRAGVTTLDSSNSNEQHNPGLGANAVTSGPVNTVAAVTLVIGAVTAFSGSSNLTAGLSYTCRVGLFGGTCGGTTNAIIEDRVLTTRQTISATWTASLDANADYLSAIAVFKAQLLP